MKEKGLDQDEKYIERLNFELEIVSKKKFADYFLIVQDFMRYSKDNDIWTGPARGSAAGSLLCFVIGITQVDPILHGLFFERFLSIDRSDIPDIDIDFEPEGRDCVKEYLIETYGRENTCSIGTYGTFQIKASVNDVCRVFEVPLAIARNISKSLPKEIDEKTKDEAMEQFPENFQELTEEQYEKEIIHGDESQVINPFDAVYKLKGKQKNLSAHAAGFIISKVNLMDNLPLVTRDGNILSAWRESGSSDELSQFGFVKYDILGLLNITFIKETLKIIKERHDKDIDISKIDENLNDPKVYKDIKKGKSGLIFQFESAMMKGLLKDAKCDDFECLSAITALGRPGPKDSGMTDDYILRKTGKVKYEIHPMLEEALGYTYGIICYQEQLMQVAHTLGGLTLAETNVLRKMLSKKQLFGDNLVKFEKFREKFIGTAKNHMSEGEAKELFDGFEKWGKYGFNKSHSVSYTIISYRCAWLKAYYTQEYICAVLRSIGKNEEKYEAYLSEATRHGIKVLPPDINYSKENFSIEGNMQIRIGLANIKGVGEDAAKDIVSGQPYADFDETLKYLIEKKVKKNVIMPLVCVGIFDSMIGRIEALLRFFVAKKVKFDKECDRLDKKKDSIVSERISKEIKAILEKTGGINKEALNSMESFEDHELSADDREEFF